MKRAALLPLSNPLLQTSCQESTLSLSPPWEFQIPGPWCSRAVFAAVTLCRTSTFKATPQCPFLLGPQCPQGFCLSANALVESGLKAKEASLSLQIL